MEQLLFYHGGPGLNSNPERNMLAPLYKRHGLDLRVWNAPSALRNTLPAGFKGDRFEQLLQDAESFLLEHYQGKPLFVLGHSMGGQVVAWLLQKHAEKIKIAFMSAPCFRVFSADRNIFSLMERDCVLNNDDVGAEKMRSVIRNLSGSFDDNNISGWQFLLSNPGIFNHYWHHRDRQVSYFSHFVSPEYIMDVDGFFETRKDFIDVEVAPSSVKTIVFFGLQDAVVNLDEARATIHDNFSDLKVYKMPYSAHYPHIEEMNEVLNIIRETIDAWGGNNS
ncbi:alpha/beta hydrolase [Compostibacter hankyongensis]|uniref:AB hydrolase-1 domain-containing protein n=1 Tax=Compostibacter hankyongensis TaxID=1007089 RepID=A0ABP8G769_9BACT